MPRWPIDCSFYLALSFIILIRRNFMDDKVLREQLRDVLSWGEAHADWKTTIAGLSKSNRGERPPGSPYSPWELLEHMRIGQWDILNFCLDPKHVSPTWPSGYWPETPEPPSDAAWK